MKRYITVEDALNAMCDNCDSVQAVCPHYPCKQYKSIEQLPSAQPEDYAELKREFNLMAAYIDAILRCSDEQKEILNWFISRLAKHMPWTERD